MDNILAELGMQKSGGIGTVHTQQRPVAVWVGLRPDQRNHAMIGMVTGAGTCKGLGGWKRNVTHNRKSKRMRKRVTLNYDS